MHNNCIVDKHVAIPDDAVIGFDAKKDSERFTVTNKYIVVIPENYAF